MKRRMFDGGVLYEYVHIERENEWKGIKVWETKVESMREENDTEGKRLWGDEQNE